VKTQLLITFTTEDKSNTDVTAIKTKFVLFSKKIFVLTLENSEELVISYNIVPSPSSKFLPNTIMVHRKRETNTIYTINALNRLIQHLNGGELDRGYVLNWEDYKNGVLLTTETGFKFLRTNIYDVVNVE
jgi:hypothetical protein